MTTVLLNVEIPGEPVAQERHRFGGNKKSRHTWHNYDPNAKDKENIGWQFIAACPQPKLSETRLGVLIEIWTAKAPVKKRKTGKLAFQTDWDNYAKFYCDAITDWGRIWLDDSQIDDGHVVIHRLAAQPRVKIVVYELP